MDLEEGGVDEDVVEEDGPPGRWLLTQDWLFWPLSIATFGRWTFNHQQIIIGHSYLKEFRVFTKAPWSNLHHGWLPANFNQSGATSVFRSLMTSHQEC